MKEILALDLRKWFCFKLTVLCFEFSGSKRVIYF